VETFAFVAGLITIVAFLIAVWQIRQARDQTRALDQISRSLTTRYLGQFPKYYPDIISLIEGAEEEILILCDFPAYGYLWDHANWIKYRNLIALKKEQGVRVQVTCPNKKRRLECIREQFPQSEREWSSYKENVEFRPKLEKFLRHLNQDIAVDELSKENFIELFEGAHQRMLQDPFTREDLCETDAVLPLIFWLVDRTKAVFGVATLSASTTEYGFYTLDQRLISALMEMRDRFRRLAEQPGNQ
jgi:hypothetical protein